MTVKTSSTALLERGKGTEVRADSIRHLFRDFPALKSVDLTVNPGEFVTLLGPSGSGKTTLLRIIAGLLHPTEGRVYIDGRDVTRLPPEKRDIGFVFQNYALFPHMSVFDNVAFPLKVRRMKRSDIKQRVEQSLDLVQLTGLSSRYPSQLSGGQQQRVALARAIVFEPTVLLMDEPLGSLDKRLRQALQIELRHLQKNVGVTAIYVTHDQDEAFTMSDRIVVMSHGEVRQVASPVDVYKRPADSFVAHFVGDINYFYGTLVSRNESVGSGALRTTEGLEIKVSLNGVAPSAHRIACGIRPEFIKLGKEIAADVSLSAELRTLTFKGSYTWAEAILSTGESIVAELGDYLSLDEGDEVAVGWDIHDAHVFELNDEEGSQ